ncbi:Adenosylhomocysteinase [Actinacidiphila cocklensis]|uniref:Adenosylhomocysteinase n=1 Tax=Actinacidiphila cocklensis TaxID=887465 RepID=A0A9W4DRA0_9ACTN|nr:Adenosylhomocysteinase [Actinacidiphila cocklensis]
MARGHHGTQLILADQPGFAPYARVGERGQTALALAVRPGAAARGVRAARLRRPLVPRLAPPRHSGLSGARLPGTRQGRRQPYRGRGTPDAGGLFFMK